jgi:positive regulator of sigma E activity
MTTVTLKKYSWLGSSLLVFFCCLFLFWLDKDTKVFSDLVQPGNLVALIIYFTPTFLLCSLLYYLFNKRMSWDNSFVLAHFIGIPVGFAAVILLLLWNMGRL